MNKCEKKIDLKNLHQINWVKNHVLWQCNDRFRSMQSFYHKYRIDVEAKDKFFSIDQMTLYSVNQSDDEWTV